MQQLDPLEGRRQREHLRDEEPLPVVAAGGQRGAYEPAVARDDVAAVPRRTDPVADAVDVVDRHQQPAVGEAPLRERFDLAPAAQRPYLRGVDAPEHDLPPPVTGGLLDPGPSKPRDPQAEGAEGPADRAVRGPRDRGLGAQLRSRAPDLDEPALQEVAAELGEVPLELGGRQAVLLRERFDRVADACGASQ